MSTIPAWRFPTDLNKTSARLRRQFKPQLSRPRYSIPQVQHAAYRMDCSIPGELSWDRAYVPFLYFHVQLKRGDIVTVVGIQNPQGLIARFRPFIVDPNYNPKTRKTSKHPELRGLTVSEAALALTCSPRSIYQYLKSPIVVGKHLRMILDLIFLYENPPPDLLRAAREKQDREFQRNHEKLAKYFEKLAPLHCTLDRSSTECF